MKALNELDEGERVKINLSHKISDLLHFNIKKKKHFSIPHLSSFQWVGVILSFQGGGVVWGLTLNCLRGRAIGIISETAFYHLLFLVCFI